MPNYRQSLGYQLEIIMSVNLLLMIAVLIGLVYVSTSTFLEGRDPLGDIANIFRNVMLTFHELDGRVNNHEDTLSLLAQYLQWQRSRGSTIDQCLHEGC